jgi:hypothetical protein
MKSGYIAIRAKSKEKLRGDIMIDKFGKVILSMVALLVFQAYLYVSEPPSSDVYFILITIAAGMVGIIISLTINHNISYVANNMSRYFSRKFQVKSNSSVSATEIPREYSVLTISLTSFIVINMVFALIYM